MMNRLPLFDDFMGSNATKRRDLDFYPTRQLKGVRKAILSVLPPDFEPRTILDPATGTGLWATCLRDRFPNARIVTVDINPDHPKPAAADEHILADYLTLNIRALFPDGFDLIMTNPPYGIQEAGKKKATPCVERFIRKGYSELSPNGWLSYLLIQGFLGSQDRVAGLFQEIPIRSCKVYDGRFSFFDATDETTGKVKKNSTDQVNYIQLSFQKGYVPQYDHLNLPLYEGGFIQWATE